MPKYSFKCLKCNNINEVNLPLGKNLEECIECLSKQLEKIPTDFITTSPKNTKNINDRIKSAKDNLENLKQDLRSKR